MGSIGTEISLESLAGSMETEEIQQEIKKITKRFEIPCWKEGLSCEEEKNIAYDERNLLALKYADGWYADKENNWEGWTRVLSLDKGAMTFHIPDSFPVGNLKEIEPNWDGHTTTEKWAKVLIVKNIEI